MHRLFVALRPPPAVRAALLDLMEGVAGARWQDDEQLHLTLRYIGEVDGAQAEDVAMALSGLTASAVETRLAGVGRFDGALWAGVAPHEPLVALHRKVDRALEQAGVAPDRRAFLPHVTLARAPRSVAAGPEAVRWLAVHAALGSPPFPLDRLILYESRLGHGGATYEAVTFQPLL